jgi:FkbM family methyltransferase
VVARIDDGYLMHVDARSFIERDLLLFGAFERELHDFIASTLCEGAVFLDVGANVGCYSLQAASLAGPAGRIFSFEPSPPVLERLRRNVDLNGFSNITPCGCALGGASARRLLYLETGNEGYSNAIASLHPSGWHGSRDNTREIQVRTMDEWFQESGLPRLDLVKIDVEGAEFEVLEGARQTLASHQPTIAMEVCEHTYAAAGRHPAMLSGFFDALRYKTERLDRNGGLVEWAGSGNFGTFTLIASPR